MFLFFFLEKYYGSGYICYLMISNLYAEELFFFFLIIEYTRIIDYGSKNKNRIELLILACWSLCIIH
jgi:hypothetical protein